MKINEFFATLQRRGIVLIRMAAFEHVTALLSFVYALARKHLLARIVKLFVARHRGVGFSGLLVQHA
jgi:hypothetical protein